MAKYTELEWKARNKAKDTDGNERTHNYPGRVKRMELTDFMRNKQPEALRRIGVDFYHTAMRPNAEANIVAYNNVAHMLTKSACGDISLSKEGSFVEDHGGKDGNRDLPEVVENTVPATPTTPVTPDRLIPATPEKKSSGKKPDSPVQNSAYRDANRPADDNQQLTEIVSVHQTDWYPCHKVKSSSAGGKTKAGHEVDKLLKLVDFNVGIAASGVSASVKTNLSSVIGVLRALNTTISEEKQAFISGHYTNHKNIAYSGYINKHAFVGPRAHALRNINGRNNERAMQAEFEQLSEAVLLNRWHTLRGLNASVLIHCTQYTDDGFPKEIGELVLYRWVLTTSYEDFESSTGMLHRPQQYLMPYMKITDVPGWMMAVLGPNEDPAKKLITSCIYRRITETVHGGLQVALAVETDSTSWREIEQCSFECLVGPVEQETWYKQAYRPHVNRDPCWVNGLGLHDQNTAGGASFQHENTTLLSPLPHILALQAAMYGKAVDLVPAIYKTGRKAIIGLPQVRIDGVYAYVAGLGHLHENTTEGICPGRCNILARWDPGAVMTSYIITKDAQATLNFKRRYDQLLNSEWIAWG